MLARLFFKTNKKCLWKFIFNLGIKGIRGVNKFKKKINENKFFPAFHFISVTDDCNLKCQGCWVTGKKQNNRLSPEILNRIITETKAAGSYFFGILGGEPLLYKHLFDIFNKHSDCYFLLFTNGTLLNEDVACKLRMCANVSPLISFEGNESVADIRRGGKNIYNLTNRAISAAANAGLITGIAMSVCKSNLNLALSPEFIQTLIKKGVIYLWYYIYRPVGENASVELCLSKEEIEKLHMFIVEARSKFDIVIIDAYWDGSGKGFCPAVSGLSHHINSSGYIEPCPVIQFSTDNVIEDSLINIYNSSSFLKEFKKEVPKITNGCIIMENPEWLASFVEEHKATDTSGRDNELERLKSACKVYSHASGKIVPEKKALYKFAKKYSFFGFGAYG